MKQYAKWVILWSLWAMRLLPSPTPPLRLSNGALVRGRLSPSGTHVQYFGIPYATAPRFQAASPALPWEGVYEAIEENIRCPQHFGMGIVLGRENCLTLNVYSPLPAGRPLLPVMVFIHGGGFLEGSGSRLLYGPDYLVAKDVVLVTMNYRLNILGFLCLGIKEAPGNVGLKDQVTALKWVQANIRKFGGDPDHVTIFGESAGAASVSYHMLSPMSRGLFHKAILQSGSSLSPWARQPDPRRTAVLLAQSMGHEIQNPYELYNVFVNKTSVELVLTKLPKNEKQIAIKELPFVPCIERIIDDVEPFLVELPHDILSRGEYNKVPVIIGFTNEEGYYFAAMEDDNSLSKITFKDSLPVDLKFTSATERKKAADELEKLYMGGEAISRESVLLLSRFIGDSNFVFPTLTETELLLRSSGRPVYSYIFEYDGWRNFAKQTSGSTYRRAAGAGHADELFYLFNLFPLPAMFETRMIDTMTTLWTNFAKYGRLTSSSLLPRADHDDESFNTLSPLLLSETESKVVFVNDTRFEVYNNRSTRAPRAHGWLAATRETPFTLVLDATPRTSSLNEYRPRAMHLWRTLYAKYRITK